MTKDPAGIGARRGAVSTARELARPYYLKWIYSRLFQDRYPEYFASCWRYPSRRIDRGIGSWLGSPGGLPDILFLPAADWHTRTQRTQHLATEFARLGHRCFYLNPHLGREFHGPYLSSPKCVVSWLRPNVYELHVHLMREPVYHHRCLRDSENRRIFDAIEQALNAAQSSALVVMASLSLWNGVAERLKQRFGCRVVCDCHDLWAGFGNFSSDLLSAEADLFSLSDNVLFSSRWLMEEKTALHGELEGKSMLVRNAVRAQDFDFSPRHRPSGRKTVAYAGSLNFWFDVDAIKTAAESHPEWDFMLLGRIESDEVLRLNNLRNVFLMGEVPYSALRAHFSTADVFVIPFRISPLTQATDPLKVYEYFACGAPVVASRLPELREHSHLVYFADTATEFVAQLETAMSEKDPDLAWRRRMVAERESWAARCASLTHLFHETRTANQRILQAVG